MAARAPNNPDPQKVELVLAQLESLPPLAPIATRILALTEDSSSHARQIIDLISADPALTARVLSVLGRAEHGVRSKSITIENAVKMLGYASIRQITLALKVMEAFNGAGDEPRVEGGFDRAEFWKHCLAVACAARRIAMAMPKFGAPDEAFVNGLLHDLGKIAIETAMPKSFDRIVRLSDEQRADIADVERQILGVDHTVVGHRLAEMWGLPQKLSECIWLHHQHPDGLPASVSSGGHVQVVQLADVIAREQRIGYSGNHRIANSSRILASHLGLAESERAAIIESLVDEIEQRAAWIGADALNSRDVYLRALMRMTDELTSANATLTDQNRRLHRERAYFSGMQELARGLSPKCTVREACGVGATTLRRVLGASAVHISVVDSDGRWMEWSLSDNAGVESGLAECEASSEPEEMQAAVDLARAGVWLAPPPAGIAKRVDPFSGRMGEGPLWLLPLVREQRWVGAAMFRESAARIAALRTEATEIEAMGGAIALAIAQAQSREAAVALSDELAEVNRRLGTVESELLQTKNLAAMVTLASGAAHELNNPLAVIAGRAQMLSRREDRAEVRESLDIIARQAHVCSAIVTELMAFAKSAAPRPAAVNVRRTVEDVATELKAAGLLADGQLRLEIKSDTADAWFDPGQLRGVVVELLRNAVEATPSSSRRLCVKAASVSTENVVVISVVDNGRGMTPDVLDRATEPFFSSRPAGRGRGLGLARVQRWLHQGGGRLSIDSEPGKGTIVEVRLPAAGE